VSQLLTRILMLFSCCSWLRQNSFRRLSKKHYS